MRNKIFTKQTNILVVIAITIVFLLVTFSPVFLSGGGEVLAQGGLKETANAAHLPTGEISVAKVVGQIIYFVLSFLGIIFVILLIYGGFIRMTAQGSSEKIKTSTGIITSAIVGIVIIIASYTITAFVLSNLKASISGGEENSDDKQENTCELPNHCRIACSPDETITGGICPNKNDRCCKSVQNTP